MHVLFGTVLALNDDGADADRRDRHADAAGARDHLAAAGRRMPRPAVPALGQPAGHAGALSSFSAWSCSISSAASRRSARCCRSGMMMLPAIAARFWAQLLHMCRRRCGGVCGSFRAAPFLSRDLPTGPAIILTAGAIYLVSMLFGAQGGLLWQLVPRTAPKPESKGGILMIRRWFFVPRQPLPHALPRAGAQAARPDQGLASFSILGDIAKQVGGDRVEVTTFVGPNGDAHVYEPTPADAKDAGQSPISVRQRPRSSRAG